MTETTVDFRKRMVRSRQQELESLDYDSLRRVIDESLTATGWSLEAGSGLGRYVHYLETRGFASVGVEISSEIAKKAKRLFPASDFIVGDVRQLPIRSDCIRNLLSLGVIECYKQTASWLSLSRTNTPSGPTFGVISNEAENGTLDMKGRSQDRNCEQFWRRADCR
jgi:hypothetical protein